MKYFYFPFSAIYIAAYLFYSFYMKKKAARTFNVSWHCGVVSCRCTTSSSCRRRRRASSTAWATSSNGPRLWWPRSSRCTAACTDSPSPLSTAGSTRCLPHRSETPRHHDTCYLKLHQTASTSPYCQAEKQKAPMPRWLRASFTVWSP